MRITDESEESLSISPAYSVGKSQIFVMDDPIKSRNEGFSHRIYMGNASGNIFQIDRIVERLFPKEDYYNSIQTNIPHALEYLDSFNERLYRESIENLTEGTVTSGIGDGVLSDRCEISLQEDGTFYITLDPYSHIVRSLRYSSRLTVLLPSDRRGIGTLSIDGNGRIEDEDGVTIRFEPHTMQYGKKTELETYRIKNTNYRIKTLSWLKERVMFNLARIRSPLILESTVPYTLGSVLAGHFDIIVYLLGLVALVMIQIAGNLLNDFFDYLTSKDLHFYQPVLKQDNIHGSSRFIQHRLSLPESTLIQGGSLMLLGGILGLFLNSLAPGNIVLLIGGIGAVLALLYSLPPVSLGRRGLGELTILVTWSYLPFIGGWYIQKGEIAFDFQPYIMVSILAVLTLRLLVDGEFKEFEAEKRAGKLTLLQVVGKERYKAVQTVLLTILFILILWSSIVSLKYVVLFFPIALLIQWKYENQWKTYVVYVLTSATMIVTALVI